MLERVPFSAERRFTLAAVLIAALSFAPSALGVACSVAPHPSSDAEKAYFSGKYDDAARLDQQQLAQKPNDPSLTAHLVQALLQQQNVQQAEDTVHKALAQSPNSAILLTSLGFVQYREGTPWLASETATKARAIDPCYPQTHLLSARLLRLNSMYASAVNEMALAHTLDPIDPEIRLAWLESLPLTRRIAELDAYLSSGRGVDADAGRQLAAYRAYLQKEDSGPHKVCRMVSSTTTTSIDFIRLMGQANEIRAFGLDVKLNDHSARLEIDTGASGLLVSRAVADRAGLAKGEEGKMGGVGDKGAANSYSALVDDIKIGGLEFKDCQIDVLDQHSVNDSDGLIGMDVLSNFLVTLDYPMRKLVLGPLPPRPDDVQGSAPSLQTASSDAREESVGAANRGVQQAPGPHDRYVAPEMKDWTPVYRVRHHLMLRTALSDSLQKLFILDTGAFHTSISPSVARQVTKVRTTDNTILGISGKVEKTYSADEIHFRFGQIPLRSVDVPAFDSPGVSQFVGMDVAGFIGFSTLGQMTLKIDYRDGLVNFSYVPGRGYKDFVPTY